MRNYVVLTLFAALCILIGCLGGGGGGGGFSGSPAGPVIPSKSAIYGKVFFPKSSLYGSIPIIAKDATGLAMGSTRTDSYGNFSFSELAPGIYNLFASTGETEVQFFTGAQVVTGSPVAIPEKELIELENVVVDQITQSSARITFTSSRNCSSQVEYGTSVSQPELIAVNNTFVKNHQVTVSGLTAGTRYSFTIKLLTQDGQQFSYPAIYTTTATAVGPTNLSLSIENGDMITAFNSVRLYINADNAAQMRFGTTENLDSQAWEGFANFREYSLSGGDGTKRIYAQFRDEFGNVSSVINDSIQLQTDRTGYIGVWINNGEGLTNDRHVVLSLLFPGATQMQISDKSDFLNSFWETYSVARKFSFSAEDGVKTIYVRFRGGQANESKTFSASIVLDTTGPEVTMKINNGALKTNNINLTLNFVPVQTPVYMQVEEDGVFDEDSTWVRFANPFNFLISKGDGLKTVYARFKDELGNPFGPISAQIELDTTPPLNANFNINNDAQTTDSLEVRLYISADDASYIMVSNNENFNGSEIERYKTIKNWSLGGYGVQSVYMQFTDDASNTTSALIQSIEVIGDPPASVSVSINQDDPSTESATVSITLFSEDTVRVRVGNHQNFSALPDINYVANLPNGGMRIDNFSLDRTAGTKTVYARFEDSQGKFSTAFDTISLTGPTNFTMTTIDTQPLSTYTVNLRLYAEKVNQMKITEDFQSLSQPTGWIPFAANYTFPLLRFPGKHTIYGKFRNDGGVETSVLSLDVTVTEVALASPAIMVNDGDAQTSSSSVRIRVFTNAYYETMRLSNDGNFFNSTDLPATDQNWFISSPEGLKTVYARFLHKDTGDFFLTSDTITAVGPTNTTVSTNETMPLNKNWVALKLFALGATHMIVTEDPAVNFLTTGWVPYQTDYNFALTNTPGAHTVFVKFRNAAANFIESNPVSLNVTLLESQPNGNSAIIRKTAALNSPEVTQVYTTDLPVFLHFDIQDVNTASGMYRLTSAGAPIPTTFTEAAVPIAPVALNSSSFSGPGAYNLYYKFADGVGNQTGLQIVPLEVLEAPASSSVQINDGDATTDVNQVSLLFFSNNATRFRYGLDTNFGSMPDNNYLVNAPNNSVRVNNFNLEPVAGVKNVYARFESSSGQFTYANDSITLVGPADYTLTTNDTQPLTAYSVNLKPFAMGATQMLITEDYAQLSNPALWQAFAYDYVFNLTQTSGKHTIYAKYRNNGNIETPVISLDVQVGTVAVVNPTITVNNGDSQTSSSSVRINVQTNSTWQLMRLSNDGNFFSSVDMTATDTNWNLTNSAGVKTVYARFVNASTGEFYITNDTITAVGPADATITTIDSQPLNKNWVALKLYAANATHMIVTEDPAIASINSGWVPYQADYNFTLAPFTGNHSIYVKFRNSDTNYIESVPVKLDVTVNSTVPSGNSASIRKTAVATSDIVSQAYPDELPVYLHFAIADANTATISWKIATAGAPLPVSFNEVTSPGAPIMLNSGSFTTSGVHNVYYRFSDGVGNQSEIKVVNIEILSVQANTGVVINEGDPWTDSATVTLQLFSDDVVRFRAGQNVNFSSMSDVLYSANMPDGSMLVTDYAIDKVAGEKFIYVRFESSSGLYRYASDSITLVGPTNYTLTTNDTQPLTTYTVNLRPYAENATQMLVTEDFSQLTNPAAWEPFVYAKSFLLASYTGQHTIFAKFRNANEVETPVISLDVTVGQVTVTLPTFVINSGDSQTNRNNVELTVNSTPDYLEMRLSNDGNFFTAGDTSAVSQPWLLTRQAGLKTVSARFKHKDTGAFHYASDTITAVGPTEAAISTRDAQPLNKNWVLLDLFAVGATDMIATENPDIANLTTGWVPYQTSLVYQLADFTGDHRVYVKYRNAATNYIETVPVSLQVTVNSTSPGGNSASLRESAAINSTELSEVAVGSLPVFLHFDIQDPNTATISYQIASAGASIPTVFNQVSAPVAPISLSTGDFPGNGTFNIYYKFADGVGNQTGLQVVSIKVLGPSLKISPASIAPLKSGQTQQFLATLENVEGTVRWFITPNTPTSVYGSINTSSGLYTAPASVNQNANFTVRGELLSDPSVYDTVDVELVTQVELIVAQTNFQITKSEVATVTVRFKNSLATGTVVSPTSGGGQVVLLDHPGPFTPPTDVVASLVYTAPATPVADSVEIVSTQDPTKKKILYFSVNDGPWITIAPETEKIRVKTGSAFFTADTSSSIANVHWRLTKGGTFTFGDPTDVYKTTTPGNHSVQVFAPDNQAINPIELVASFTEGVNVPSDKSTISLESDVKVTVSPKNQKMYLAETTPLLFLANVENATTSTVIWQYRNASETSESDWVNADNYTDDFNGILRLNQGESEYLSPATWPKRFANGPSNKIQIRAVSIDDYSASDTTVIELIEPLKVKIFDGFNNTYPEITNSSISVTLEVGKRQLFGEVGPVTDPTINTTVNWSVQGIAGGNTTYGTIDTTGKFTAPDTAPQAAVTVRAVSAAKSTSFGETTVNLVDFWTPRSNGLTNATNATDSIFCLRIDPTSALAAPRILYCGTNGFGVYRASIAYDGSSYEWNNVSWNTVSTLSTTLVGQGPQFIVNQLAISYQNSDRVVAATNGGLFQITNNGTTLTPLTVPYPRTAPTDGHVSTTVNVYSETFTEVFSSVVIDPTNDNYLYAIGRDQGVLRFIWNGSDRYVYNGTLYDDDQDYSIVEFYEDPWTVNTGTIATPTMESGSLFRPMRVQAASTTMEFNCAAMTAQNPNVLYVGFTKYLENKNPDVFRVGYLKLSNIRTSHYLLIHRNAFMVTGDPIPDNVSGVTWPYPAGNPEPVSNWHSVGANGIITYDSGGIIQSIAIDPNTATTIWRGKNSGIERSTDDGSSFAPIGNYTNVRDIFIDPINTVNVYIGTEAGLYRTKDAGASWKQIKSGLEGNTTLNALGLTPGGLGTRRIFLGTTNGVFMGRTSLDLE